MKRRAPDGAGTPLVVGRDVFGRPLAPAIPGWLHPCRASVRFAGRCLFYDVVAVLWLEVRWVAGVRIGGCDASGAGGGRR